MPCCFGCGQSPSMRRAMPREPQSAVSRAVPAALPEARAPAQSALYG